MIGKAEWFTARKFGWGLGVRTKEGVAYIIAFVALLFLVNMLPIDQTYKLLATGLIVLVLVLDTVHMMTKVYARLDEREQQHQAIAERNASFMAVAGITIYIVYMLMTADATLEKLYLPIGILLAMSIAKGATLVHLEMSEWKTD